MRIIDGILPEFDYENANTRKVLERVPEAHFAWKPHEKSMSMGMLAGHLAENPGWAQSILTDDVLDMDPAAYKPYIPADVAELLATFDKNIAAARALMEGASDADLMKTWTMKVNGKTLVVMPKAAVIRSFLLSHSFHHRGQLTVYLRMKDVPLPSLYGPTADEPIG